MSSFDSSKEDDYGHYIDVTKSTQAGDIGYVLLNNGQKVGGDSDRKITLIDPNMNEVWVDNSFNTYTYQPLAPQILFVSIINVLTITMMVGVFGFGVTSQVLIKNGQTMPLTLLMKGNMVAT